MRQIKFRVWNKKLRLWVAGWKIEQSGVVSDNEELVFMQFTGMADKNGKEIYEGDICEIETLIEKVTGKVVYSGDRFEFVGEFFSYGFLKNHSRCEVIGNEFENEHLSHQ